MHIELDSKKGTGDTNYRVNTKYVIRLAFISALGGYLFGFDFAVIAGALPFLQEHFGLNSYWEGFATGSLALGAIVGCLAAGFLSNKAGRKPAMQLAAAIFALSSLSMALSSSRDMFLWSRFAAGIGVGMASMLSPMYIAEISTASIRGRLVALNQLTVVLGILVTNVINYLLRNQGDDAWRWMFGLGFVPSLLFFIGAFFLPESPRWLFSKGNKEQAKNVLTKMGDDQFTDNALQQLANSLNHSASSSNKNIFKKGIFGAVLIGITLAALQQLCGINTVFNYAPRIFESIGATQDNQLFQTILIGAVNLVFTVLALVLVDRWGRKPLMLLGFAGLSFLYLLIIYFLGIQSGYVAWFLLASIAIYALTLAPVTWVLISEIFPTGVRTMATTVAVLALWLAYFVLVFTFPVLFEKLEEKSFYVYAAICLFGFAFVWFKLRETNGKDLDAMNASGKE